eukprot:gene9753-13120_t
MSNWATLYLCPALGVAICTGMWLSPWSAVMQCRNSRDMDSLNPLPFVATVFNCLGWTIYGCQKQDYFLFWANCPGVVLGMYYSIISLTILAKKTAEEEFSFQYLLVERLLLFAQFFWCLMAMISSTVFTKYIDPLAESEALIGTLSMIFSLGYYGAPLSTMAQVIQSRDSSSLYPPLILTNLINATLWTCYGFFGTGDLNLYVPNGIGGLLAISQLTLYFIYRKEGSKTITEQLNSSIKFRRINLFWKNMKDKTNHTVNRSPRKDKFYTDIIDEDELSNNNKIKNNNNNNSNVLYNNGSEKISNTINPMQINKIYDNNQDTNA